jgi:hypothetical protein
MECHNKCPEKEGVFCFRLPAGFLALSTRGGIVLIFALPLMNHGYPTQNR